MASPFFLVPDGNRHGCKFHSIGRLCSFLNLVHPYQKCLAHAPKARKNPPDCTRLLNKSKETVVSHLLTELSTITIPSTTAARLLETLSSHTVCGRSHKNMATEVHNKWLNKLWEEYMLVHGLYPQLWHLPVKHLSQEAWEGDLEEAWKQQHGSDEDEDESDHSEADLDSDDVFSDNESFSTPDTTISDFGEGPLGQDLPASSQSSLSCNWGLVIDGANSTTSPSSRRTGSKTTQSAVSADDPVDLDACSVSSSNSGFTASIDETPAPPLQEVAVVESEGTDQVGETSEVGETEEDEETDGDGEVWEVIEDTDDKGLVEDFEDHSDSDSNNETNDPSESEPEGYDFATSLLALDSSIFSSSPPTLPSPPTSSSSSAPITNPSPNHLVPTVFIAYPQPRTPLSHLRQLLETISQTVTRRSRRPGFIYGYTHHSLPGFIKIGFVQDRSHPQRTHHLDPVNARLDTWQNQCGHPTVEVFRARVVCGAAKRIESLVHQTLRGYRRVQDPGCVPCEKKKRAMGGGEDGGKHNEWFEVNLERVRRTVGLWALFAGTMPYDKFGRLTDYWAEKVEGEKERVGEGDGVEGWLEGMKGLVEESRRWDFGRILGS